MKEGVEGPLERVRAVHGKDGDFLVGGEEVTGLWSLCSLAGPQVKMWGRGGPLPSLCDSLVFPV